MPSMVKPRSFSGSTWKCGRFFCVSSHFHHESPSQHGRPDIVLKDKKGRRAIIIEAKKSANRADMEKDCGRALAQVDTRKYAEGLYGYTQVLCYGIAFFQKEALVRKG